MDLNQLKLSPHTLTALYKNLLVQVNETGPAAKKAGEKSSLKFLGENRRNILIAVNYPETMHIPDEQLGFLINLLTACKLNLGDVAVLNIHHYTVADLGKNLSFFTSKIVFLFGVEPTALNLPISFPHFQVQEFSGATYLFSPDLTAIEQDKILKSKLWVCMRRIFNL